MKQTIMGRLEVARKFGVTENTISWLEKTGKIKPTKVKVGAMWFMTYDKKAQEVIGNYTSVNR